MHTRSSFVFILVPALAGLVLFGCDASTDKDVVQPMLDGKADVSQHVNLRGPLAFGEAVAGAFDSDLVFDAYTFDATAMSDVRIDITHKGSSSKLDTTLFVYGRKDGADNFGGSAIAFDDDSGWGRLSRIDSLELEQPGTYLIVVGTATARGRGHYRLALSCNGPSCALPVVEPSCHPDLLERLELCIADTLADPEANLTPEDALDLCADPEVLAGTWDTICAAEVPAPPMCMLDIESFSQQIIPACRDEAAMGLD